MNTPGCNSGHVFVSGRSLSRSASLHGYYQPSSGSPAPVRCHTLKTHFTEKKMHFSSKSQTFAIFIGQLVFCHCGRHHSCEAYGLSGLTIFGPGLDGHRTGVEGERVVKEIDLAVDLCVYDDVVLDGAVAVDQQVLGAVGHFGFDAAQA